MRTRSYDPVPHVSTEALAGPVVPLSSCVRCEVWIDPDEPGVTCRRPAVAVVRQERHEEYHACAEHAREARRSDLDVTDLRSANPRATASAKKGA